MRNPSKPIKVLQVFTILNLGGAETNLMNYFRQLDSGEIHFDFLVHRDEKGFFENEILQKGSKIFRLPPIHPLSLGSYKKKVDAFFRQHAKEYDIVHGQLSELGVYIYEAAKKYGIPVRIAHAHNSKMDWDLKGPFRFLWKHRIRKSVNGYFSCGQESSKWLFGEKLAQETFILPNSINVSSFQFQRNIVSHYQKDFEIPTNSFLHVGRFDKQKNHSFLVSIFAEIVKKVPEAKLFLIGVGELKNEIENQVSQLQIQDNVVFLGQRNDVNYLMLACQYFLFPSLFEGFSVAMLEAQASGMYSFISDGIPEEIILIKDKVKVISLKKSPEKWAEIIINSMGNLSKRDHYANEKVKLSGYDVVDNTSKLIGEYKRLLQMNQQ